MTTDIIQVMNLSQNHWISDWYTIKPIAQLPNIALSGNRCCKSKCIWYFERRCSSF